MIDDPYEVTQEQAWEIFDRQCRHPMDMTATEFCLLDDIMHYSNDPDYPQAHYLRAVRKFAE